MENCGAFKYCADMENCGASRGFGFIFFKYCADVENCGAFKYLNIVLTWKIVVPAEVSVLYIYIYIYIYR